MVTLVIFMGCFICFIIGFITAVLLIDDSDYQECDCDNPNYCDKDCIGKEIYFTDHRG